MARENGKKDFSVVFNNKAKHFHLSHRLISLASISSTYSAFLILLFVLFTPSSVIAAAWLQDKCEGLMIGNIQPYTSDKFWDKASILRRGPRFNQFAVNPYIEYGLLSNLTIVLNPTILRFSQAGKVSPFALGYTTMGGRFLLKKKDYDAYSFQILYNQPSKSKNFAQRQDLLAGYTIANLQRYLDIRLLYGTGGKFDPKEFNSWYADAEMSYRPYFNGAADELHFDGMLGFKTLNKRLIFEVQVLNTISLRNPKHPNDPNFNLLSVMPNIIYWFSCKSALQLGIKQDVLGTNVGKGTSPFVALWVKF